MEEMMEPPLIGNLSNYKPKKSELSKIESIIIEETQNTNMTEPDLFLEEINKETITSKYSYELIINHVDELNKLFVEKKIEKEIVKDSDIKLDEDTLKKLDNLEKKFNQLNLSKKEKRSIKEISLEEINQRKTFDEDF
jgi:hypothetical protein